MQGEFIVHENTTPLPTIHVVSDSVGLTAQALARAAAAQFGVTNPNIEVLPHVRSFEEVKQFIAEHGQLHKRLKGDENLLIFYTLVDGDLRRSLSDYCESLPNVVAVDLMTDAMNAIANGDAVILFQGMFTIGTILEINPDAEAELRASSFPAVEADVKPAINQTADSTYYLTADSANQEASKEFLDWLFTKENQVSYTETRNAPSAFTDVTVDIGPIYTSAQESAEESAIIGATVEPAGFGGDASGIMLQEFFAGQYTPSEFAAAYENAWKAAFDAQ